MKSYVLISGLVFLLVVAAHVARMFAEGAHVLKQPVFAGTSVLSLGLAIWAWIVFRRLCQRTPNA